VIVEVVYYPLYSLQVKVTMTDQSVSSASNTAKMEALLEQLRNKHLVQQSSDSWNEFAKQIRMSSLVGLFLVFTARTDSYI